jgi:predicted acyltransferase
MSVPTPAAPANPRVVSIDALRGFDMFWICGGKPVVLALLGLFVTPIPQRLLDQMNHPAWEGFSAWDLIMPLFLFIVGTAMPFSFAKRLDQGQGRLRIYGKMLLRVLLLWVFGMIAQGNLLKYDLGELHVFSNTLQAIAVGYFIAGILLLELPIAGQVVATVVLLVGYWLALAFIPVPGHEAGLLQEKLNLALYLDELILGRFRDGTTYTWILSGMSFAATVLLGVLSGHLLRSKWSGWMKVLWLAAIGLSCLGLGWLWSFWFPIIKHLFTSSAVLWAAGWSYLLLALFYLVIDVIGFRRWAFFFVVIGANAIAAYMLTHTPNLQPIFYQIADVFLGNLKSQLGSCAEPLRQVAAFGVFWTILWYLYRKGTFLRV